MEVCLHLAYWLFHFTSVNTNWEAHWTDRSIRDGVAQVTILLYPVIFYLNAFILIPRFLKGNQWLKYGMVTLLTITALELVRSFAFVEIHPLGTTFEASFWLEFTSQDNLLFGLPNSLIFAILFSMLYRFTRDWIIYQRGRPDEAAGSTSDSVEEASGTQVYRQTLQAKRRDSTFILQVGDIAYLQSQGDFVMAFDKEGQTYTISQTLATLENSLDPDSFFRINRSEIIHATYILKFANHTKNRLAITLKSPNETLYTSNSRSPDFRKWLESMA